MNQTKDEYVKVKTSYRVLASLMCLFNVFVSLSIFVFVDFKEIDLKYLPFLLVPIVFFYICVPITFTGYPPKTLFWMLEKRP